MNTVSNLLPCLRRREALLEADACHEEGLWWLRLYPALNMPHKTLAIACDIVTEAIESVSRKYGLGIA